MFASTVVLVFCSAVIASAIIDDAGMPLDKMLQMNKTTAAQRKAAAIETIRKQATVPQATSAQAGGATAPALVPSPLSTPDVFGPYPNWSWSPLPEFTDANAYIPNTGIRKFVNQLPTFGALTPDLNLQLGVAVPDTITYPGSDYYEISLEEVTNYRFHSDLPAATKVRGYRQTNNGTNSTTQQNTVAPPAFSYLGPVIIAQKDRPVRVKFTNNLPTTANGGNLFVPTDLSMMGAGLGPNGTESYPQNRGTIHLHGGMNPWISDGTPHQWITPAGEGGSYTVGASTQNVPDMPAPGGGSSTFYYTNQQSARLMFYHDHALGITRLNVYVGEAAGYLVRDTVEQGLETAGIIPPLTDNIPVIIEDRTFVADIGPKPVYSISLLDGGAGYSATPTVSIAAPTGANPVQATASATVDPTTGTITALTLTAHGNGYTVPPMVTITDSTGSGAAAYAFVNSVTATDPTWRTTTWGVKGGLWYPHVYMPNQTGSAVGLGANAMGRWDYALWFWPPYTGLLQRGGLMDNPYYDPVNAPWEPAQMPIMPDPSTTPEAFHDTPTVNGVAYPYMNVDPKAYRLRILNACNDRMLNLQLYVADPDTTSVDAGLRKNTEVRMIPVPQGQSVYGKASGIPDPTLKGPNMIQIGNEGGFLPAPVVLTNTSIGYETNPKNIVITNVKEKNLFMGPAERADVIVDFSQFAGKTIILYNDSPAPVPAFETRVDYYTGDPDQTGTGGAPSTIVGFGPNTRTIMQFRVGGTSNGTAFDLAALQNAFKPNGATPSAYAAGQNPVLVPQEGYNSAYGKTFPTTNYVTIQANSLTFTPMNATTPVTVNFEPKAIQELFETNYGRLNALLGVEMPFTNNQNQTTIPIGYAEPTPDNVYDNITVGVPTAGDNTMIWKITHNGVDTHPIHFHLYDVQVLNRVGWDGAITPPDPNELGWKETVRMNPLEDCIVALRPVAPKLPFGVPNSVRVIDPTIPLYAPIATIDPLTNQAVTVPNIPTNYNWEYVWHCHILSHEENDMMHTQMFHFTTAVPEKPMSAFTRVSNGAFIWWTDATKPVLSDLTTLGNPANEIGFKIMRAQFTNGALGAYTQVGSALANQTSFTDTTGQAGAIYSYKVVAYNVSGESWSIPFPVTGATSLLLLN
jgi:FtsP/CotA-like multicopper oxidase with cupredoxin domain